MKYARLIFTFALCLCSIVYFVGCSATKATRMEAQPLFAKDDPAGARVVQIVGKEKDGTGQDITLIHFFLIHADGTYQYLDTASSAGAGMLKHIGPSVVSAAGFAGGMYLRTMGRPDSVSVSQNGGGANVGSISQEQGQGQEQGQIQEQEQGQAQAQQNGQTLAEPCDPN